MLFIYLTWLLGILRWCSGRFSLIADCTILCFFSRSKIKTHFSFFLKIIALAIKLTLPPLPPGTSRHTIRAHVNQVAFKMVKNRFFLLSTSNARIFFSQIVIVIIM